MSKDSLRDGRLKQATGLATRLARNQIIEAEKVFAPVAVGDDELRETMWAAYMGHIVGRLIAALGRGSATAIMQATMEEFHDH